MQRRATDAKLGVSFYTSLYVNIKIHSFILFGFIVKMEYFKFKAVLLCVCVGKRTFILQYKYARVWTDLIQ